MLFLTTNGSFTGKRKKKERCHIQPMFGLCLGEVLCPILKLYQERLRCALLLRKNTEMCVWDHTLMEAMKGLKKRNNELPLF